jgi:branched-chain amino acid aminotransferase
MLYNQNGVIVRSVQLDMDNRSFLYGDGLFERLRLFNGNVFNKDNHHKRLSSSLKELQLNLSISVSELLNQVEFLANKNGLSNCGARISIYRNSGGLYTPNSLSASYIIESIQEQSNSFLLSDGIELGVYDKHLKTKGILSTIKSSSANFYVLASIEKKSKSKDELLLLNTDRRPIEGTNSNLFIVKDGNIFTPPLSEGALSGCMRSLIISSFKIEEKSLRLSDVECADEVFFTNCNGLKWVKKFNNKNTYSSQTSRKIIEVLNGLI